MKEDEGRKEGRKDGDEVRKEGGRRRGGDEK
jgi:hypothetical protein